MKTLLSLVAVALLSLSITGGALAASPTESVLPVEQYTSEKGRTLAQRYGQDLRNLGATLYHCMPWVEVQKYSIGFYKPRHLSGDDRYLSVRIFIEQDPSPAFASLPVEGRASAMFSRYVGPLLRRMAKNPAVLSDTSVDGFTVILEWLKQASRATGTRPVHETIAVFVDRPTAAAFLSNRLPAAQLTDRVKILGWDGETPIGAVQVVSYEDNFVSTYKLQNYKPDPGVVCP